MGKDELGARTRVVVTVLVVVLSVGVGSTVPAAEDSGACRATGMLGIEVAPGEARALPPLIPANTPASLRTVILPPFSSPSGSIQPVRVVPFVSLASSQQRQQIERAISLP